MDAMAIHSVFCSDCGGWEEPRFGRINDHEGHIFCNTCDEIIALVRTENAMPDPQPDKKFRPVFAGYTDDNEKIILYQHVDHADEIHIQRPDGELWALSPQAKIKLRFNWEYQTHADKTWVSIKSPEWTGEATGTRQDLIEAEAR